MTNNPVRQPKILLLSAYDAASHQHWRKTLVGGLTQFHWTVLSLPARHFYWRARSNALTFATQHKDVINDEYDLVLATSMVDISALRGLIPGLARVPLLVYFHENQFVYPLDKPSSNIINAQLTSVMNFLCADRVLFNSRYNQQSFVTGANSLLQRMPDGVDGVVIESDDDKSSILPVPITMVPVKSAPRHKPVEIVWNHRWEYDKQPEVFFVALRKLKQAGVDFVVHVLGQSFRQEPSCFGIAKDEFASSIGNWGFQPREDYERILAQADIVVSTATHDFQGLSLLEAISAGCLPVAPDRVAYTEYVPDTCRYRVPVQSEYANAMSSPELMEEESTELCKTLITILETTIEQPDVNRYAWHSLKDDYQSVLLDTMRAMSESV